MSTLSRTEPTLPSAWYYDDDHYAAELEAVWYRDWVCVGRLEEVPRVGDWFRTEIGTQCLIVTRAAGDCVRVFHNTCRHRGSALCTSDRGHFRNGRIICPYHTWTYSTSGELVATPGRIATDDFRPENYPLYSVAADTWGGFIFICLARSPDPLSGYLGEEGQVLANWPLADMVSVQTDRRILHCNWKVFWENYSECYHCPRVHPELCKVVEIYGRGFMDYTDDPDWRPTERDEHGRAVVAPGYRTWALTGETGLPDIPGPSAREQAAGMRFASFTASMFVVGHPDYVRSVRMLPRGPESIELVVDWLLLPAVAEAHRSRFESLFELGRLVVEQDGRVCEWNQSGLRSRRHEHGVLMPQEYNLSEFHGWLRGRLDALAR